MSLRLRLLLAFAYVLTLVIVALEVPLGLNLSRRIDAEIRAEAAGQAQILAASAAGRIERRTELVRLVRGASEDLGGRVIVVDPRGRLLADSAGSGRLSASYASRPEISRAVRGETVQGQRRSESLDQELLYTAVPILDRGRRTGAVRITQSVAAVDRVVRNAVVALIAVGLGALALGLAVAWVIAGSLARPLRALAETARRIARGDLSARAEPSGSREQRETAEAFNEMTDRLGRSLAVQRDFTGNASHQLRTPLTGLKLRLEAAALKATDPGLRHELAAAEHEADRLARIVTQLLALAGDDERPSAAAADLGAVAEAALTRWEGVAERDGRRIEARGDGGIAARASGEELATVLDNLIENAIAHSPADGAVTIEWGAEGSRARIAVLDEGSGIGSDDQERAFERFYRGRSAHSRPGSGLGLAVVRSLVDRWDGEVRIENRPEGGARATVWLERLPASHLNGTRRQPAEAPE